MGDTTAGAAEGEGGTNAEGQADVGGDAMGFVEGVGDAGAGHVEADVEHGLLESGAVFGRGEWRRGWAPIISTLKRVKRRRRRLRWRVERGLAAEGREDGVDGRAAAMFGEEDLFKECRLIGSM